MQQNARASERENSAYDRANGGTNGPVLTPQLVALLYQSDMADVKRKTRKGSREITIEGKGRREALCNFVRKEWRMREE